MVRFLHGSDSCCFFAGSGTCRPLAGSPGWSFFLASFNGKRGAGARFASLSESTDDGDRESELSSLFLASIRFIANLCGVPTEARLPEAIISAKEQDRKCMRLRLNKAFPSQNMFEAINVTQVITEIRAANQRPSILGSKVGLLEQLYLIFNLRLFYARSRMRINSSCRWRWK